MLLVNKKEFSPIVLFVYNRKWHTEQTIEALKNNELASESVLYVFSDSAKKEKDKKSVEDVRKIIRNISGFKKVEVIEASQNIGCADSIIQGISHVMERHGKAIIIEDDIVTAPNFLEFMNEALIKYEKNEHICSVSGFVPEIQIPDDYTFPVFLGYRNSSWGWGTWKNMWEDVDWEVPRWSEIEKKKGLWKTLQRGGEDLPYILKLQMENKIDAWDIRFYVTHALKNRFTVFPVNTFVRNIGLDGSGIHCGKTKMSRLNDKFVCKSYLSPLPDNIPFNSRINDNYKTLFKYGFKDILRRKLKDLLVNKNG